MKKQVTRKRVLALNTETIRQLADRELTAAVVVGGGSGTYCVDCGTGTACPWLKI
ncbi:MAG TPA: hypothetical protein VGD80_35555 [Kofleriaceae bacterium]|jgi:hypothetical protein